MAELQKGCIYCQLVYGPSDWGHEYRECKRAQAEHADSISYEVWRSGLGFPGGRQCWGCGLPQSRYVRIAGGTGQACAYQDVIFQGSFILWTQGLLMAVLDWAGFTGEAGADGQEVWQWMSLEREGFGAEQESNWMGTWRRVYKVYQQMCLEVEEGGQEGGQKGG